MFRKMGLALGLLVVMSSTSLAALVYNDTIRVSMPTDAFRDAIESADSYLRQYLPSGYGSWSWSWSGPNTVVFEARAGGDVARLTIINTPTGGFAGSSSVAGPAGGTLAANTHVVRSSILNRQEPGEDNTQGSLAPRSSTRVDMFYNMWEVGEGEGAVKGFTAGINPTIIVGGETFTFTTTLPIHFSQPEDGDWLLNAGADIGARLTLGGGLSIGAHGAAIGNLPESTELIDPSLDANAGPYVAFDLPLGRHLIISLACLYELIWQDVTGDGDLDSTAVLIPAANVGLSLGESAAINVYAIHHMNQDDDSGDSDYTDVGADFVVNMSESWVVSLGARKVVGIDGYESLEGYLGSQWGF